MAVDVVIGFDNLAVVWVVGLLLTCWLLVPAAGFDVIDRRAVEHRFQQCLVAGFVMLWLTSVAWLITRTAAMSGQTGAHALAFIPTVLFQTHFGMVWWLRAAALLVASIVLLIAYPWRRLNAWPVLIVLLCTVACVAASRSAAGHAAADGDWTLREVMDWLHWAAISTWGGSLTGTLVLVFPRLRYVSEGHQAKFARRLSLLATGALALVLVSGIFSAWHMLPAVSAFWQSAYGRTLGVKLLLVAAMVVFGAFNHYRLVPAMQTQPLPHPTAAGRRLALSVCVEAVLLLGVLAVTAVLLGSMPPM